MCRNWYNYSNIYGGYEYECTGIYANCSDIGTQFITADKEFVKTIIESDGYLTGEEWTNMIDSNSKKGMAENMDKSLLLTSYSNFHRRYKLLAQYFMGGAD